MNCTSCANSGICRAPCGAHLYARKRMLRFLDQFLANDVRYRKWVGGHWIKFYLYQPVGSYGGPYWKEIQDGDALPSIINPRAARILVACDAASRQVGGL